jgi:predicted dehydrogenase
MAGRREGRRLELALMRRRSTLRSRRVGIIGYGLAGRVFHAPLIAATPGLEVGAIVTSDPGRAAQARNNHPGAEVVPDAAAIFARPDPLDLVVVATPNDSHVPLALRSIEAGVAVVIDKPLAAAVADGRRLIERSEAAGVLLTVFQNRRWDNDFLTLRSLLDEGRLGRVHRFESRFQRWRPQLRRDSWREDPDPRRAGGLLYDLGAHVIDQALVLFGPVTSVYAELDRRRAGSIVDDDVFVSLTHLRTVDSPPRKPYSSTSRSQIRWAVWRCFRGALRSSSSHRSTTAATAPITGSGAAFWRRYSQGPGSNRARRTVLRLTWSTLATSRTLSPSRK